MIPDTRKSKILLRITAMGCAVFCIISIVFIFRLYSKSDERSRQYLYDATQQTRVSITQQIDTNLQILYGVALSLGELGVENKDKLQTVLQQTNESNVFFQMGLFSADGIGFLVDLDGSVHTDIDLSPHAFFTQAMAGNAAVTDTFFDSLSGQYVNYYAVPITRGGLPLGVLCAVNSEKILAEPLSSPVFHGSGYYVILDSAGQVAGPAVAAEPRLIPGTSFPSIAAFQVNERVLFDEGLRSDTPLQFSFTVGAEKKIATLEPLGVNGWVLLSVVPVSAVQSYYNTTVFGATIMVLAACCIFGILLITQRRTLLKNQRRLEHLAYTDSLTGAPSYAKFCIDAEKLLEKDDGTHYTIWSFDVKQFRHLNDILGYETGDTLLIEITEVLFAQTKQDFLFCRATADRFTGMVPWQDTHQITEWFSSLVQQVNEKYTLSSHHKHIDMSMGAYRVFADTGDSTVSEMVNRANIAKEFAKEKIGSHIAFFRIDIADHLHRKNLLETSAKPALEKGEFTFFLQPKIGIQNGYTLSGAEALARWISPDFGLVSPAEFIPLFEKSGFVVELDRYIFEEACRWYSGYLAAGHTPIYLSVNVSRLDFLRDDFVEHYTFIKNKYHIPDGLLELELTESLAVEDYVMHEDLTQKLQQNGFFCSIDDFGSGYSSLNVLKNLPVNTIKLDAVFFRGSKDIERERIVIAYFISMAAALGMRTVAEGVETVAQVDFLRRVGCDVVQGYIFSKPLPREDFEKFAENAGHLTLENK